MTEWNRNEWDVEEAAKNCFAELRRLLQCLPDVDKVYLQLHRIFVRLLNEHTSQCRLILGGTFAKLDYLLKERSAPVDLARAVNNTRLHLQQFQKETDEKLHSSYLYDYANVCRWAAFLYDVAIPKDMVVTFPIEHPDESESRVIEDTLPCYLRMIVDHWDDEYVYGYSEMTGADCMLKVEYAQLAFGHNGSYLQKLYYSGAQINIVWPEQKNGILHPRHIVFEPDYLVDISTIAACFTNYAESPLVALMRRLQPQQATEDILLGNLAGKLLDEEIYHADSPATYQECVRKFWRENVAALLAVKPSADFHQRAKVQQENIRTAVGTTLEQEVAGFCRQDGMVEPSFFSEMLGLQGRMDYLQLDYKVLIEQKAGKGAFPYNNFVEPKPQEAHYVQMLLYMALIKYNFSEEYRQNKGIRAFLLYSKYQRSLLALGNAPELEYRAIRLRNRLVRAELMYANEGGYRILNQLTPERLNERRETTILWQKYQSQQITQLLDPIHNASELERCYYLRFLTFISKEHLLCKLGNKTKENSGFAAKWHDSLDEKLQAGNIYDRLTLLFPNEKTKGAISQVRLAFSWDVENDISNFRTGDIVLLYPYPKGNEPDVRRTPVLRSTIVDIQSTYIDLCLRSPQSDARFFLRNREKLWAVEHDFMESSFSALYRGLQAFLSAPQERKDLLLLQREPMVDETKELQGDYGPFNELSLRVKQAQDLFLIIGPPGTGKTSFGMLNTLQEELCDPESSVLLLSYTNRAVDELCSKLCAEGINFIRIGSALSCPETYRAFLLDEIAAKSKCINDVRAAIDGVKVVVGTTTAMNGMISLFNMKQFTMAIIDEASQILEPHLIGLLSTHNNGVSAIRKMVFIGDHKQLPAVVQQTEDDSKVEDDILREAYLTDCRLSLFERLLRRYHDNPRVVYMLRRQGRMHPDVALFANKAFYGNQLDIVPRPHQCVKLSGVASVQHGIDNLLQTRRLLFLHSEAPIDPISDKVNDVEMKIITELVLHIYQKEKECFTQETIGVIVPYRNQIATLRNQIGRLGIDALQSITIDTVERFQGSQRKYVIYGFTVQKYYQLNFLTSHVFQDWDGAIIDRKLNVAMTRAEDCLIMVGNTDLLKHSHTFARLIDFVRKRQGYFRIPLTEFLSGNFIVSDYQHNGNNE